MCAAILGGATPDVSAIGMEVEMARRCAPSLPPQSADSSWEVIKVCTRVWWSHSSPLHSTPLHSTRFRFRRVRRSIRIEHILPPPLFIIINFPSHPISPRHYKSWIFLFLLNHQTIGRFSPISNLLLRGTRSDYRQVARGEKSSLSWRLWSAESFAWLNERGRKKIGRKRRRRRKEEVDRKGFGQRGEGIDEGDGRFNSGVTSRQPTFKGSRLCDSVSTILYG